jgi:Domain of unknown function (DU1801)
MEAEAELAGFVAKFAPVMQDRIRSCRAALHARFPNAVQLVYDNYNFLVIGFGPTARTSEAIFSLASHARGTNLFFLQHGAQLPDPNARLQGTGKVVRFVRLDSAETLDDDDVRRLIDAALLAAAIPMTASDGPQLLIKSVSAKQRPRR